MKPHKNGRTLAAVILACLFLTAVACSKTDPAETSNPVSPTPPPVAEVVFFQGEVLVGDKAPDFGDRPGTAFTVKTGKGARCDLVFGGGNAVSVGQNAVVFFDFTKPQITVRVDRGGLSSVLKKLDKLAGSDSFVVQTGNAVAGVRGTSFCVWVDDASTYVCACNGRVRTIDSRGSQEELLESSHHTARLFTRAGAAVSKETAGLLHHDDASLQSVADRIGYVIDWGKVDE